MNQPFPSLPPLPLLLLTLHLQFSLLSSFPPSPFPLHPFPLPLPLSIFPKAPNVQVESISILYRQMTTQRSKHSSMTFRNTNPSSVMIVSVAG